MVKVAFIFPGQGSQSVAMGRDLYDNFKAAKEVFEEASDSIRIDVKDLCFNGPKQELDITYNTQPALLTVSTAAHRVIMSESGLKPDFMAGHSLGEYSALVASNTLSFADAVKLVRFRGKVMSEAATEGSGTMAAILGLTREVVGAVIDEVKGDDVLTAANYNCPGQIIISGTAGAVERAIPVLKQKGAKRALKLAVSGPFHSSLMEEAAERLKPELDGIRFSEPEFPVYSNVTAKPYGNADEIAPLLVEQISSSVMWEDTVNDMINEGASAFIEVGPGKVLTGLVKRINKDAVCCNVLDTETLKNTVAAHKELGRDK
jgi:[acyl-carrier-protein] S-malonyltransferase